MHVYCYHISGDHISEDEGGEGIVLTRYPWEGSDRDYKYEEVWSFVYD